MNLDAIYFVLSALFLTNLIQAYFLLSKSNKQKAKLDISASDLLHELTVNGSAILKVDVMDRDNLLLRLPRG